MLGMGQPDPDSVPLKESSTFFLVEIFKTIMMHSQRDRNCTKRHAELLLPIKIYLKGFTGTQSTWCFYYGWNERAMTSHKRLNYLN